MNLFRKKTISQKNGLNILPWGTPDKIDMLNYKNIDRHMLYGSNKNSLKK